MSTMTPSRQSCRGQSEACRREADYAYSDHRDPLVGARRLHRDAEQDFRRLQEDAGYSGVLGCIVGPPSPQI